MNDRRAQTLSRAVAEAVLTVPGVACLRPGLRSLLRAPGALPLTVHDPATPGGAVLITWGSGGTVTGLPIDVVVRAQHQAAVRPGPYGQWPRKPHRPHPRQCA
ncbi:hypothetical protein [Streptomyces wedmorensis]|uniref:hypothetical protein n=1 Tax=Streptomyces wedmorensis TaxID=43759 RepID=UPI0037917FF3